MPSFLAIQASPFHFHFHFPFPISVQVRGWYIVQERGLHSTTAAGQKDRLGEGYLLFSSLLFFSQTISSHLISSRSIYLFRSIAFLVHVPEPSQAGTPAWAPKSTPLPDSPFRSDAHHRIDRLQLRVNPHTWLQAAAFAVHLKGLARHNIDALVALSVDFLALLVGDAPPAASGLGLRRRGVFDPFRGREVVVVLLHGDDPGDVVECHCFETEICFVMLVSVFSGLDGMG